MNVQRCCLETQNVSGSFDQLNRAPNVIGGAFGWLSADALSWKGLLKTPGEKRIDVADDGLRCLTTLQAQVQPF